jgi:hypothetical protein
VKEEGRKLVRGLCGIEGKGTVQTGDQEEVGVHLRSATFSITSGGAVASGSGRPGGVELRFWVSVRGGEGEVL